VLAHAPPCLRARGAEFFSCADAFTQVSPHPCWGMHSRGWRRRAAAAGSCGLHSPRSRVKPARHAVNGSWPPRPPPPGFSTHESLRPQARAGPPAPTRIQLSSPTVSLPDCASGSSRRGVPLESGAVSRRVATDSDSYSMLTWATGPVSATDSAQSELALAHRNFFRCT
jgi:hypothetical protein